MYPMICIECPNGERFDPKELLALRRCEAAVAALWTATSCIVLSLLDTRI